MLQSVGLLVSTGLRIADGLMPVDVALLVGGMKIAVEIDGPSSFTANRPHRVMQKAVFRNAMLASRGWRVASVPWFEWQKLRANEKLPYLKKKIENAVYRE